MQIDQLDLSKQNNFGKSYKNSISKILSSVPKVEEVIELAEPTIDPMEQFVQETIENDVVPDIVLEEENKLEEEKSIVKKSRKKTKNVE